MRKCRAATLANVATDNGGKLFGFLADVSVGAVTAKTPAFKFDKTKATPQDSGDFQVKIV